MRHDSSKSFLLNNFIYLFTLVYLSTFGCYQLSGAFIEEAVFFTLASQFILILPGSQTLFDLLTVEGFFFFEQRD